MRQLFGWRLFQDWVYSEGDPQDILHVDGLLVNAAPALTPHMYSRDAVSAQTCPNSLFHFRPQGGWPTESTFLQDHQRVATASMVVQQHDPIMIDVMISGGLPIQSALIPKDVLSAQRHSSGTPSSSAPPAWLVWRLCSESRAPSISTASPSGTSQRSSSSARTL